MSHETFQLIDRLRRDGSRAAMATLVRTSGTTPRKEGTKMFVGQGGSIFGSVTIGGCVDARVIEQSASVLETSKASLLNLQLGDEEAWEIGLSCGGAVDVLVEPVTNQMLQLYDSARAEWDAGRSVAIGTVLASGEHFLIDNAQKTGVFNLDGRDVYVEVLKPPSTMVVFGAGAVAIPLVTFAKALGFRSVVVDARPRFATRERFADADDIRIGIASMIAEEMKLGAETPIVLVAHDYKIDLPVLTRALAAATPYIGLLGSRRRGAAILQLLRDQGVAEEQLRRVRVPIGLDLGGESASDIALAIIAEVVAVLHGRNGSALCTAS